MYRLILIILIFISFTANGQEKELIDYFSRHSRILSLKSDIDFGFESSELNRNIFFAIGEVHRVPSNQIIKLQLLKYLHRYANVRILVVESGSSDAFLLNRYLVTGDTSLIRRKSEVDFFWSRLKQFNDANSEKIKVIGIDFERNEAIRKTFDIIFKPNPPIPIENNILELQNFFRSPGDIKERERLFKRTTELIKQNREYYKTYLADHFQLFNSIIINPVPVTSKTKRDKYMVENFYRISKKDTGDKYFGQFGISHTNRNYENLIGLLNSDNNSPINNKVMVIMPHYFNCQTTSDSGDQILEIDDFGLLVQENIKVRQSIAEFFTNDIVLIDLRHLTDKYENLQKSADHLILIKNQKIEIELKGGNIR